MEVPSPFRRRWQRCDRLCWSRGGAMHSPPSGAAVPARPCRAQDPMEAWLPVLLPGEAARPPVPRASPCQATRRAEPEPWHPGCLLHPPQRVDHRPIPSYPKGSKSHGRQDFGQAPLSSLPSAPNLHSKSGILAKTTWRLVSPDLAQQLCPLPVLHGHGTQGLGLGFILLVDPGALNKQLWCICSI